MASPLSVLRKHQKVLLVVFGVTLMVLFLVGSFLPDMGQGLSSQVENPVVVTWKGGKMTRLDLDLLRYRHYQTINLLNALRQRALEQHGQNYRENFVPIEEIGGRQSDLDRNMIDEEVFRRFLFAKMAEEEGITISESFLDNYLAQVAGGVTISRSELEAINRTVNRGEIGIKAFRRHLALELAAQMMMQMTSSAIDFSMSPLEIAQRYSQTSRRIDCEVIPVKVSDFLDRVTEQPTEAQLRQLFTEGQRDVPDPNGEKPGFKLPRRFALQYVTAKYETFLTNEINKLTDKEVQEEYERRVAANDPLVYEDLFGSMPDLPPPGLNPTDNSAPAGNKEEEKSESDQRVDGEQETSDDGGEVNNAGDNRGSNEDDDTVFTAWIQDESQHENSAQQDDGVQSGEPSQKSDAPQTEQGAAVENATRPVDSGSPQDDPPRQRRVRPLAEVASQLKRAMKSADATNALEAALLEAEGELRTYDVMKRDWDMQGRSRGEPAPAFPDLKSLANRLFMELDETPLIDVATLRETAFAKANPEFVFHVAVRFNEASLFQPFRCELQGTNATTLFWFTEKRDPQERSFAEAKDDVLAFWRRQRARELAQRRAQTLADQVNTENKSLYEIDPALARTTGEFSFYFLSRNPFRQDVSYEIDRPANVEAAGEEFMKAAFSLQPGKATTAFNADRTIVYVIRMIADATAARGNLNDMLYDRLVQFQMVPQDLMILSRTRRIATYREWNQGMLESQEVRWLDR